MSTAKKKRPSKKMKYAVVRSKHRGWGIVISRHGDALVAHAAVRKLERARYRRNDARRGIGYEYGKLLVMRVPAGTKLHSIVSVSY
jgi:hypothetical protein